MQLGWLKPHLVYQSLSLAPAVLIFWSIMILVGLVAVMVNTLPDISVGMFTSHDRAQGTLAGTMGLAIVIFTIVIAVVMIPENLSFLLGLGSSRRHFYLGVMISLAVVAFLNAGAHSLALVFERPFLNWMGVEQMDFLSWYRMDLNHASLALIHWMGLYTLSAAAVLVSSLFYRNRSRMGMILLIVALVASLVMPAPRNLLWQPPFLWLASSTTPADLAVRLLVIGLALFGVGWLILRKTEAR